MTSKAKQHAAAAEATTQPVAAPEATTQPVAAPAALPSRSIVPVGYRKRCVRDKQHKTPGGNPTVSCGDALARYLAGKTVQQVAAIAESAGAGQAESLLAAYAHLNPGQQRMNIGNRIRALVKEGSWTVPAAE